MSIQINGIDKPKSCFDCPCIDAEFEECAAREHYLLPKDEYGAVLGDVPDWCPITELQTCDDAVSRQAAIEALANTKDLVDVTWTDENDNVIDSIEEKRNIIANWLEKVPPAQPDPQWIPTKVKPDPDLPEDDMSGYFLVTLHTYGNIGFNMDEYEVKKMRWDRVNGWGFPVHSPAWIEEALTQEVLAWKPCPEPYRGDGVE